jgi:hypothetical protein
LREFSLNLIFEDFSKVHRERVGHAGTHDSVIRRVCFACRITRAKYRHTRTHSYNSDCLIID